MVKESGLVIDANQSGFDDLERFAKLVRDDYSNKHANLWLDRCHKFMMEEREACAKEVWPELKVWSEEELQAMTEAFNRAHEKHGWYETLMAVGASVLKMKAAAIRARGEMK